MEIQNIYIIPDRKDLERSLSLVQEYGAHFEYNDFFLPVIMDDEKTIGEIISLYESCASLPGGNSMHGAFLDVTIHSDDPLIRKISDIRIRQSIAIAQRAGVKRVVFHTGLIPGFILPSYLEGFEKKNEAYFRELCAEFPDMEILMENMFDDTPAPLAGLAAKLKDVENFGVCFDYAHAHVFGKNVSIEEWVQALAPYVKHLHINDNDLYNDSHDALGSGKIDYSKFKKYYETYFPTASVLLEVSGYEKAKCSLQYLKEL